MSWSVSTSGTRDDAMRLAGEQFDACAKSYEGTEEARDIMAAKERALSVVQSIDLTPSEEGKPQRHVHVFCYGSRSTRDGKVTMMSAHIDVSSADPT